MVSSRSKISMHGSPSSSGASTIGSMSPPDGGAERHRGLVGRARRRSPPGSASRRVTVPCLTTISTTHGPGRARLGRERQLARATAGRQREHVGAGAGDVHVLLADHLHGQRPVGIDVARRPPPGPRRRSARSTLRERRTRTTKSSFSTTWPGISAARWAGVVSAAAARWAGGSAIGRERRRTSVGVSAIRAHRSGGMARVTGRRGHARLRHQPPSPPASSPPPAPRPSGSHVPRASMTFSWEK